MHFLSDVFFLLFYVYLFFCVGCESGMSIFSRYILIIEEKQAVIV